MKRLFYLFLPLLAGLMFNTLAFANGGTPTSCPPTLKNAKHPFYAGVLLGYGSTDWDRLSSSDLLVNISTLKKADDDGLAWGLFAGVDIIPHFGLEFDYTRFANTTIQLSPFTIYNVPTNKLTFTSKTELYSLIGKFMVPIPHTPIRAFADAGVGFTHRSDILANTVHVGPTFGAGFNMNIGPRVLAEIGFQYTTGFGRSGEKPVIDYVPYTYTAHFKLAYRFSI